jgi:hypothetical protein
MERLARGMVKIKLTGRNLGRVFKSKIGHAFDRATAYIAKWPNLKLKTQPKQLIVLSH